MKKVFLSITIALLSCYCMAQNKTVFPFRGGKANMMRFFNDSLKVSPEIIKKKATGLVVFKFTSDDEGKLSKIVVYYADDAILIPPVIEALKKSARKWMLPDHETANDFIITFSFGFNPPAANTRDLQKAVYDYINNRKPIISANQSLLDTGMLLPTIIVKYDLTQ
ncbi:MAG: hypothetical protein JWQ84_69 [Mucilaginibacter sp.]|nr:hypothetical protein [Mucilaginibacter sp.]